MRIVFMGTPDFAVPCLKRLVDDGNEVVGVFTQPDKPKGRGYTLTPPPVKVFAEENGIPVFSRKACVTGKLSKFLKDLTRSLTWLRLTAKFYLPKYCIFRSFAQ